MKVWVALFASCGIDRPPITGVWVNAASEVLYVEETDDGPDGTWISPRFGQQRYAVDVISNPFGGHTLRVKLGQEVQYRPGSGSPTEPTSFLTVEEPASICSFCGIRPAGEEEKDPPGEEILACRANEVRIGAGVDQVEYDCTFGRRSGDGVPPAEPEVTGNWRAARGDADRHERCLADLDESGAIEIDEESEVRSANGLCRLDFARCARAYDGACRPIACAAIEDGPILAQCTEAPLGQGGAGRGE